MAPFVRGLGAIYFVLFLISLNQLLLRGHGARAGSPKEASGMMKLTVLSRCFISNKYAMARFGLHYIPVRYFVASCTNKKNKCANVSCWSQLRSSLYFTGSSSLCCEEPSASIDTVFKLHQAHLAARSMFFLGSEPLLRSECYGMSIT